MSQQRAVAFEPATMIVIAACVALGLVVLASIAHNAMEKNYTMDGVRFDTEVDKSGKVGNKFGFNLKPPPLPTPG